MKRREIAVLAAAAVLAIPHRLSAQPLQSPRVGVLHDRGSRPPFNAIFRRLGDLGWVEGRNLNVELLTLDWELKQSAAMVKELVRRKCDVILATGTPAAMAVKANAPAIPMVFIIDGDPVSLGLVAPRSKPGGNATGYIQDSQEIILRQLSLLREIAPSAKRIAVMFEAGNPSMRQSARTLQAAAARAGIEVEAMLLRDWRDVEAAALRLESEPANGLIVTFDRTTFNQASNIVALAERFNLPAIFGSRYFVESGALVSYGINWDTYIAGSADYLARILGGEKPADLPVQQASQFELVVNLHKARRVGQTIPQSVLLQATEVFQ